MRSQDIAQAGTCYEVLQVQPSAPLELITAAYWHLAGKTQARRGTEAKAEGELHRLTLAYLILTNPTFRAEYDASIGVEQEIPTRLAPQVKQGWFQRARRDEAGGAGLDHYELLRVAPFADDRVILEAYNVMRPYFGRLINNGYAEWDILDQLDEAYSVLSDPNERLAYDEQNLGVRPATVRSNGASGAVKTGVARNGSVASPPQKQEVAESTGAGQSQPGGVSGMATGAIGAMGRQLTKMSKREQRRTQEKLAERVPDVADGPDPESVLLKRISSTVEPGLKAAPGKRGAAKLIARVMVVEGQGSPTTFDLNMFPATIGGAEGCDITLPGLAEHHATLLHREGRFVVFNLKGREPGEPEDVDAVRLLENGDELKLGAYKLLFSVAASEPSASSKSISSPA